MLFSKRKKIILISILTLLVVGGLLFFWYWKNQREKCHDLVIYGNIDIRQVNLGFRVFGRVEKLYFEEGDLVEEGMCLALLDQAPYLQALKSAEANAEQAQATYENAKIQFQRRNTLSDSSAISKEERDNFLFQEKELLAAFDAARANLEVAKINLNDTQIFCPTTGNILSRIREPGTIVNVGDPVYSLSIQSPVWVRTYVSEPDLGNIYFGMKAEVKTDTPGRPIYEGHIGFISPVAEFTPKTVETTTLRTDLVYRLRIIVDNPDYYLRQGMPVTVTLRRCNESTSQKEAFVNE